METGISRLCDHVALVFFCLILISHIIHRKRNVGKIYFFNGNENLNENIGTDDIRAPEHTHRPRGIFRSDFPELHSTSWPFGKSIYENPIHAADRINVPGYRCVRKLLSFLQFVYRYR
jgi:hypothetical protein